MPRAMSPSTAVAMTIAFRSPNRATSTPDGMSKTMVPIPRRATIAPANAGEAPRSRARRAITGMAAPWPMENRKFGR